jgi:dihydroorotase
MDREALLRATVSGNSKFFLGTDSAPHPGKADHQPSAMMSLTMKSAVAKRGGVDGKDKIAAGVFTQPYATQTVLSALEEGIDQGVIKEADVTEEKLRNFLSGFGRAFYRVPDETGEKIVIKRGEEVVQDIFSAGSIEVVPFRRGKKTWTATWK